MQTQVHLSLKTVTSTNFPSLLIMQILGHAQLLMPVITATQEVEKGESWSKASLGKSVRPYQEANQS
jgi:hypothetical protein